MVFVYEGLYISQLSSWSTCIFYIYIFLFLPIYIYIYINRKRISPPWMFHVILSYRLRTQFFPTRFCLYGQLLIYTNSSARWKMALTEASSIVKYVTPSELLLQDWRAWLHLHHSLGFWLLVQGPSCASFISSSRHISSAKMVVPFLRRRTDCISTLPILIEFRRWSFDISLVFWGPAF